MTPVHAAVLDRARKHLTPDGEAWLVLSDVAGHLGLCTPGELLGRIAAAGPHVVERTQRGHTPPAQSTVDERRR